MPTTKQNYYLMKSLDFMYLPPPVASELYDKSRKVRVLLFEIELAKSMPPSSRITFRAE